MNQTQDTIQRLKDNIGSAIVGKPEVIEYAIIALIAKGRYRSKKGEVL